jgi:hypothetical protein
MNVDGSTGSFGIVTLLEAQVWRQFRFHLMHLLSHFNPIIHGDAASTPESCTSSASLYSCQ